MARTLLTVSAAAVLAGLWGCGQSPPTEATPSGGPLGSPQAWPASAVIVREPEQRVNTVRPIEIGRSVKGEPIHLYRFGPAEPKAGVVLVLAAIHGDEVTTEPVARRLVELLESDPTAAPGVAVAVVPVLNPDGLDARRRTNASGVDLNRNLPAANWKTTRKGAYYNGPKPESEPETRALIRLVEELKPVRILSIHSIDRGRECNNYDGPAGPLAEMMSRLNGYPARATIGYPTPGSFGSWAGIDRKIPVITLEFPRTEKADAAWARNRTALLAFLRDSPKGLAPAPADPRSQPARTAKPPTPTELLRPVDPD